MYRNTDLAAVGVRRKKKRNTEKYIFEVRFPNREILDVPWHLDEE